MAWQLFKSAKPYCPPTPDRDDVGNIVAGISHRIGRVKPNARRIKRSVLDRVLDDFFPARGSLTMDFDVWLEGTQYTQTRKKQLRTLRERMMSGEVQPDHRCKMFIKAEGYDTYKNPRMICSRDDTMKVTYGPIFKPIEDYVFSMPMFIKHVPVCDRARYIVDYIGPGNYDYIVNDHTSFETHAHTTMADFEFAVYERLLSTVDFELIQPLLGAQKLYCFGATATVHSRMSGEMNTSLGNGLANFLSFAYLMYEHGAEKADIKCIIEGDDAIFCIPKTFKYRPTPSDFSSIGFVVVMDNKDTLGTCGFCSTYFAEDGSAVVVDPAKVFTRMPITFSRPHGRVEDLRFSKALSCCVEYRGVPILQALGQRLLKEYPTGKLVVTDWWDRQMLTLSKPYTPIEITDQARNMFEKMFGWNHVRQVEFESFLKECPLDRIFANDYFTPPTEFYEFASIHKILDMEHPAME